ncbi:MAG: putative DNA-binding domain-containing protein [Sphingorhabdus sp.]|uniref:HvfC/BufC family peptide modification chaperone n=1 Tax=Sphingorhabdus sp. TaxID=1902408 RepID=UPI0038FD3A28
MLSLVEAQNNFIDTINEGPDRLDPQLFDGPADRIILGLKAHANTINHARIVALEDTFPLTREYIGDAEFNRLARDFVESEIARASDNNHIGLRFPYCLGDAATIELAQIEWAWLESYNAAEATALTLSELSGLDQTHLLELPIAPHPSARLVPISSPMVIAVENLTDMQPSAILTVRPETEVRLVPLNRIQMAICAASAENNVVLGNLLAIAIEQAGEQAPLDPIFHLIGAGALIKAG